MAALVVVSIVALHLIITATFLIHRPDRPEPSDRWHTQLAAAAHMLTDVAGLSVDPRSGQLLALSVYRRYEEGGAEFVPRYLDLLRAGGSMSPEDLGRLVDCDLADPGFWDGGLDIVQSQLDAATTAATDVGIKTGA